jgi:hypothetical protein
MGLTDTFAMGKSQIQMIKTQMEIEQKNLAEIICAELKDDGFECLVKSDGQQTMRAGIVPVRIERLRIVPTTPYNPEKMEKFEKEKERIAKYWAKMRQDEYKREMKELKEKEKKK